MSIMPKQKLFNYIVAKQFFEEYCPEVGNWKHKLRGLDGNKKEIDFTPEDKKLIKQRLKQFSGDLKKMI